MNENPRIWEKYDYNVTHTQTKTFRGHKNTVTALCWAPHGTQFVTGSLDCQALIWNAQTEECLSVLEGHKKGLYSVSWSPDANFVASASRDCTARLWDVGSGLELQSFSSNTRSIVWSTSFTSDGRGLLTAYMDGIGRLYDVEEGTLISELKGHSTWITCCACSPELPNRFATASKDGSVILWDKEFPINTFIANKDPVQCLQWSHDGKYIVTGSKDCRIRVWDVSAGKECLTESPMLPHEVLSCSWSADNSYIAASCADESVKLFDAKSGKELYSFNSHQGTVTCLQWSPQDNRLATSSSDSLAKLWDIDIECVQNDNFFADEFYFPKADYIGTDNSSYDKSYFPYGLTVKAKDSHIDDVNYVSEDLVEDSQVLNSPKYVNHAKQASCANDFGTIDHLEDVRVQLGTGNRLQPNRKGFRKAFETFSNKDHCWHCRELTLYNHDRGLIHCSISPDGESISATCRDKSVVLWNTQGKREEARNSISRGNFSPTCFAWSYDGTRAACGYSDGSIVIFNMADEPKEDVTLLGHSDTVCSLSWSPVSSNFLVTGSHDCTAIVWDICGRSSLLILKSHKGYIRSVVWSPLNSYIVTVSSDNTAKMWGATSGNLLTSYDKHNNTVYAVSWHPKEELIATGCRGGKVHIWRCNGDKVHELAGHNNEVWSCAWSISGNLLVSGSWDGDLIFWDPLKGVKLSYLPIHTGAIKSLCFSKDGTKLISASLDTTLRTFELSEMSVKHKFVQECQNLVNKYRRDDAIMLLAHILKGKASDKNRSLETLAEECTGFSEVLIAMLENVEIALADVSSMQGLGQKKKQILDLLDNCKSLLEDEEGEG